ncbi:shikimate kinase [Cellulomonas sp. KRMCY2]|uniref:shikimate kinase n=1 Tax=Cellulomonas sp. KRMCY2 TaxID=1304865 RepID=UPI00045E712E|nr:shikimate kinase [Cellulomonas sp. KRMCY2]
MDGVPVLVLVGPAAVGKSTLGALVADRLGVPFVDVDELGDQYYVEVGWSIDRLVERATAVGRVAAEREWEPARAHAVRRVLDDHPGAVVALGAGHTSFTDPRMAGKVSRALSAVPHVALILPSLDRDDALVELRRRSLATKGTDWVASGHDFLAEWLDDKASRRVATLVVITDGEAPGATAGRLLDHVRKKIPPDQRVAPQS